jgi:hypothetical protein
MNISEHLQRRAPAPSSELRARNSSAQFDVNTLPPLAGRVFTLQQKLCRRQSLTTHLRIGYNHYAHWLVAMPRQLSAIGSIACAQLWHN